MNDRDRLVYPTLFTMAARISYPCPRTVTPFNRKDNNRLERNKPKGFRGTGKAFKRMAVKLEQPSFRTVERRILF